MSSSFDPWRDPLGEIDDVLLVTASAGSGKTWMIAQLAARWLLEGGGEPHELLMVTFSRAAAAELRVRLRRRLHEIAELVASLEDAPGAVSDDELAWVTALVATQSLAGLRARLRSVLSALDTVHARTIHSFAAMSARREESELTDALRVHRAASQEAVTRAVTSRDADVSALIDQLESGTATTPGGARLATMVARSLGASDSAGGLSRGSVTLTGSEDRAPGRAVAAVLRDADGRTRDLLAVSGAVTFDDLIGDLARDVDDPQSVVAERLRAQFRLVLIDEFQDTDAQQWRIFDTVFRAPATAVPLIVVGDPKQAIYGFRGGDVSVLERLRSDLAASGTGRELALTVNFRSAAGLLSALNALFGASTDWQFGDATTIAYAPVVASPDRAGQAGRLVVRRSASAEETRQDLVVTVASLLGDHTVSASDVAILCRSHSFATDVRVALERAGIVTATIGGGSVFSTVAVTHVRTLLWVLLAPTDPRRFRLLAATWFATLTTDEVAAVARDLSARGVAVASRTVLGALAVRANPLAERDLADVEQLLDVLGARHGGPVSADVLIGELDAGRATDVDDADASARRRVESDRDAVRVMTIHAAKGLQFPIVLIPQIEARSAHPDELHTWTNDTGRTIDVGAFLGQPLEDSPFRSRSEAEDRRLMYVALTRAHRLCVAWATGDRGQWPRLVAPVLDGDVREPSLVVQTAGDPLGDLADLTLGATPPSAHARPRYLGPAPRLDESGRRWSYSALRLGATAHPDDAGDAEEAAASPDTSVEPDVDHDLFDGRRGATLGVAVHQALEWLVGSATSTDRARIADAVASAWRGAGLGAPGEGVSLDIATLLARPLGVLTNGYALESFSARGATVAEMRFTMPLRAGPDDDRVAALAAAVADLDPDGPFRDYFASLATRPGTRGQMLRGFLTGSLDLVLAVGEPARYVIIDYKTNQLAGSVGYEPAALHEDMARAGYPVQALLYAVALHRFLRGRVAGYAPERHLGGVGYLYVRGAVRPRTDLSGLATWNPPSAAVVAASDILDGGSP